MAKRIRFGFVFEGQRPDIGGQTPFADLDVAEAEGCEKDGRQFVVFTVCKPRRVSDVERVVEGLEGIRLVSLDGGPMIATFERGHSYQGHPIYRTIQSLCANCDVSYWRWSLDHPQQNRKKRVISELESDLADAVILPAAEKRASKKQRQEDAECILPLDDEGGVQRQVEPACPFRLPSSCYYGLLCIGMRRCMRAAQLPSHVYFFFRMDAQIGKRPTSSTKEEMKRASSRRAPSSKRNFSSRQASLSDCSVETVMALVKEVTRSKDETIRAKEHTIKLLESFMDMTGAH